MTFAHKKLAWNIVAITFFAVLAVVANSTYHEAKMSMQDTVCLSNVKKIGLAALTYAQDYDERLPLATSWETSLLTKGVKRGDLDCPAAPSQRYGYAMNLSLSGASLSGMKRPDKQLTFFESSACLPNASGSESLIPNPPRHANRSFAAFADGHAGRWISSQPGGE